MSDEYEIEVVMPQEGKEEVPPFLVSFPGGDITSLEEETFCVKQSDPSKKRRRHTIETQVGDLRFMATDRLAVQDLVCFFLFVVGSCFSLSPFFSSKTEPFWCRCGG